jgi:hypothetical protein
MRQIPNPFHSSMRHSPCLSFLRALPDGLVLETRASIGEMPPADLFKNLASGSGGGSPLAAVQDWDDFRNCKPEATGHSASSGLRSEAGCASTGAVSRTKEKTRITERRTHIDFPPPSDSQRLLPAPLGPINGVCSGHSMILGPPEKNRVAKAGFISRFMRPEVAQVRRVTASSGWPS